MECLAATSATIGTPKLDIFLRGLTDEPEVPDTYLVWRWDTAHLVAAGDSAAAEALDLFRPEPRELARVPIHEAGQLLKAAVQRLAPLPLLIRDARGQVSALSLTPDSDLPGLAYATVLLPPEAGGLRDGLPDPGCADKVLDLADSDDRLRRLVADGDDADLPDWVAQATTLHIPLQDPDDEEAEPRWLLYALRRAAPDLAGADSDLSRLAAAPQTIADHTARVAAAARRIGTALGLPPDLCDALETAGRWHDTGKGRRVWPGSPPLAHPSPSPARAASPPRPWAATATSSAHWPTPGVTCRPDPGGTSSCTSSPPTTDAPGPASRTPATGTRTSPPPWPRTWPGRSRHASDGCKESSDPGDSPGWRPPTPGCRPTGIPEETPMAHWPIDPLNPGEVLACCGIAHLAWRADRAAVTGFTQEGRWRFQAPDGLLEALPAPAPAEVPDGLSLCGLDLDWWQPWGLNPDMKTWAGQQTPLSVHRNLAEATGGGPATGWQTRKATTTGRLNLDIHGTWNALTVGWSLNEHKDLEMSCRPWLELLASLGLQAFPVAGGRRGGFRYHLWHPAPLTAAIAAFQGHGPGVYALSGFTAGTGKLGSKTMLLKAKPIP